jgi:hypothetical protein
VGKEVWKGAEVGISGLHDESNNKGTRIINYTVHQHINKNT